ncbi:MAG: tripartite tricarboxylate transporter TctB family protein [Pyramidobacter sp.]|jgi:hypothetical protein
MQEFVQSLDSIPGLLAVLGVCAAGLVVGAAVFCACGKKDRLAPLLVALAFAELACAFLFLVQGVEEMEGADSSSRLMPRLWAWPLLLASIVQIRRIWRAEKCDSAQGGRIGRVVLTFLAAALAISQLKRLGFFLSTTAMLVVMMLFFGERRPVVIASSAAFWLMFSWLVFYKLLMLNLPTGTLFAGLFA